MGKGVILVDLDGVLAEYRSHQGWEVIGAPIMAMVFRVQDWLADGYEVRIFTARVAEDKDYDVEYIRTMIEDWTETCIGTRLAVTNQKDRSMRALYDDRAYRVEFNSGRVLGEEE